MGYQYAHFPSEILLEIVPGLTHKKGAVGMARSQDPNSASSQFYICLNDAKFLDGNYAVFGQVIEGQDVVEKIIKGDKMLKVIISETSTPVITPTPILTPVSTSAPTVSIVAANNPDTSGADMKIQHKGGDTLKGGEWKLSIVAVGQPPLFKVSNSDLFVGGQIIATTTTCDAAIVTDQSVTGCSSALSATAKYDIKLVHIPSNAMLLDQIIEVR